MRTIGVMKEEKKSTKQAAEKKESLETNANNEDSTTNKIPHNVRNLMVFTIIVFVTVG